MNNKNEVKQMISSTEREFMDFFMSIGPWQTAGKPTLAPSMDSEAKRMNIFQQIKTIIIGAYLDNGYQFDNWLQPCETEHLYIQENQKAQVSMNDLYILKYGSDPLKTYLPDSDIDITVICPRMQQSQFLDGLEQLKLIQNFMLQYQKYVTDLEDSIDQSEGVEPQCSSQLIPHLVNQQRKLCGPQIANIKDIVLVDQADVEIIKVNYMGVMIDISIGQIGGLCTLDFMNYLTERLVGNSHMMKRSILLLKSFLTYECSLLGSQLACMATYGLYALIAFVGNCYSNSSSLDTEMSFFRKFYQIFDQFDWDNYMITIYGPVRIQNFYDRLRDECNFDMNQLAMQERKKGFFAYQTDEESLANLTLKPSDLQETIDKYSALRLLTCIQGPSQSQENQDKTQQEIEKDLPLKFKKSMNQKYINIVDPCFSKNNLGKSISLFNSYRLRESFAYHHKKLETLYSKAEAIGESGDLQGMRVHLFMGLLSFFRYSLECTGILPSIALKMPQMRVKQQAALNPEKENKSGIFEDSEGSRNIQLFDDEFDLQELDGIPEIQGKQDEESKNQAAESLVEEDDDAQLLENLQISQNSPLSPKMIVVKYLAKQIFKLKLVEESQIGGKISTDQLKTLILGEVHTTNQNNEELAQISDITAQLSHGKNWTQEETDQICDLMSSVSSTISYNSNAPRADQDFVSVLRMKADPSQLTINQLIKQLNSEQFQVLDQNDQLREDSGFKDLLFRAR